MVNLHGVGSTEAGFGGCDDNFTLGHSECFKRTFLITMGNPRYLATIWKYKLGKFCVLLLIVDF